MARFDIDLADRALSQTGATWAFHASAVAIGGHGALLLGKSGAGKSSVALAAIGYGAQLLGDDLVRATADDGQITLTAGENALEAIEARGIGLLATGPLCPAARLALVVDLDQSPEERLPPRRHAAIAGQRVPLILGGAVPSLAAAIVMLLRHGFADTT